MFVKLVVIFCSTFILVCAVGNNSRRQQQQQQQPQIRRPKPFDPSLGTFQPALSYLRRFPYYLSGFDEENRPIWVIEFGKWDVKKEIDVGEESKRNLSRYIDHMFWRITKSISLRDEPDYPVTDGIVIIDMDGYTLYQASVTTIQFLFNKAREIEPHTPHMEKGFVLNVNFVAQSLFNVLKPVMGTFLAKSDIHGTNRAKWIPDLIQKLPRESLPPHYGGLAKRPVTF